MLEDTLPAARKVLIECWRRQTPERRFRTAVSLSMQGRAFMLAGIRARNPGASVAEIRDVFERESFGEELAERVRRWRERVGR